MFCDYATFYIVVNGIVSNNPCSIVIDTIYRIIVVKGAKNTLQILGFLIIPL